MGFGPNPTGVHQAHLVGSVGLGRSLEATDVGQAERHEFATFEFTSNPFSAFLVPSLTSTALVERGFGGNAPGNVGRSRQARGARVDGVGCNQDATDAAEDLR